jgi:hypothetical protein
MVGLWRPGTEMCAIVALLAKLFLSNAEKHSWRNSVEERTSIMLNAYPVETGTMFSGLTNQYHSF